MKTETVELKVIYDKHDEVVLINSNGDTYISKSEDLMDFLHDAESVAPPPVTKSLQACKDEVARGYDRMPEGATDYNFGDDDAMIEDLCKLYLSSNSAVQEWISVKDRFPENERKVLVQIGVDVIQIMWYSQATCRWIVDGYPIDQNLPKYWQPLPNPPTH